jgi:uncharacterized membrane protein YgdD (TMEM256/DUF423 family)
MFIFEDKLRIVSMKFNFIVTGAFLMALAVGAGAFGAHGLKEKISPEMLEIWEKAVYYMMIHAIGILLAGILLVHFKNKKIELAGLFFLFGIVFFSGSLFLLALKEISFTESIRHILGPITPLGGISFIAGWVSLAFFGMKKSE